MAKFIISNNTLSLCGKLESFLHCRRGWLKSLGISFGLLLGVEEVVNLVLHNAGVCAHNCSSFGVKVPVGNTEGEMLREG